MAAPAGLVDRFGRPLASPSSGRVGAVRRAAASHGGTLAGWYPGRHTDASAPRERELIARRAEDLAANDAHAAGLIEGLSTNVVGTGLNPQSQVDAEALGIDEDAGTVLRDAIEKVFDSWARHADAGNRMTFDQMQFLITRTMLIQGEFLALCVNTADADGNLPPGRSLAMALQSLSPQRIQNPVGAWFTPDVHDGVKLGACGEAIGYWIAQPDAMGGVSAGQANTFRYYPARHAHRPVVLHGFPQTEPEQVRGRPVLAPAMKFFRDLNDCLDNELVGQLVASCFPVAITSDQTGLLQNLGGGPELLERMRWRPDGERIASVEPGSILQLYQGEDIKALESPRPGNNFETFVSRILRAAGAAAGQPYEVVVKDFSKTNYSSARAALLEAWRVFRRYQLWLEAAFCLPVWRAVVEEAFVRGLIAIPAGAPDFYAAMDLYLAVSWIPPRMGHVDPTKETAAEVAALEAGIATDAEVIAARGGDWEAVYRQRAREKKLREKLGLDERAPSPAPALPTAPEDADPDAAEEPPAATEEAA